MVILFLRIGDILKALNRYYNIRLNGGSWNVTSVNSIWLGPGWLFRKGVG